MYAEFIIGEQPFHVYVSVCFSAMAMCSLTAQSSLQHSVWLIALYEVNACENNVVDRKFGPNEKQEHRTLHDRLWYLSSGEFIFCIFNLVKNLYCWLHVLYL